MTFDKFIDTMIEGLKELQIIYREECKKREEAVEQIEMLQSLVNMQKRTIAMYKKEKNV